MSLDARYILVYGRFEEVIIEKDKVYLEEEYGGELEFLYGTNSFFWDKPKHKLPVEEYERLNFVQILEMSEDDDCWKVVYDSFAH